jgi:hypothetical protein
VDFFNTLRGTQRTPQEKGYHVLDTRHNLSLAISSDLPAGIQLSGIVRALSGSPRRVQSGIDIDGDGSVTGDRPSGLPPTVGREDTEEQAQIINEFRVARGLQPIDPTLLDLDPYLTVDLRATKAFRLFPDQRLDLFFEVYNATNHVNFSGANQNMNAAAFFIRTSARAARQMQWGLRYLF